MSKKVLILCIVSILGIFILSQVAIKTKNKIDERDLNKHANRIALKAVGMDDLLALKNFVIYGDAESVAKYLEAGHSVDTVITGTSLLELSIVYDQKDVFDLLVKRGANVTEKNRNALTPMGIVLRRRGMKNAPYYIQELLKAGAPMETNGEHDVVAPLQTATEKP